MIHNAYARYAYHHIMDCGRGVGNGRTGAASRARACAHARACLGSKGGGGAHTPSNASSADLLVLGLLGPPLLGVCLMDVLACRSARLKDDTTRNM